MTNLRSVSLDQSQAAQLNSNSHLPQVSNEMNELNKIIARLHAYYDAANHNENDIYIEPVVGLSQTHDDLFPIGEYINRFLQDPRKDTLLLRGEAGSGKTTIVQHLLQKHWDKWNNNQPQSSKCFIPILIPMSQLDHDQPKPSIIDHHLNKLGLLNSEIESLKDHCQKGDCHLLILLDDLDENAYTVNNLYKETDLMRQWGNPKVITTSRTQTHNSKDCESDLSEIYLQPFNDEQIHQLINDQTLLAEIADFPALIPFVTNPFFLSHIKKILPLIGYDLELKYTQPPREDQFENNQIYLYLIDDMLCLAAKDKENHIERISIDDQELNKDEYAHIKRVLNDPLNNQQLDTKTQKHIVEIAATYGFPPKLAAMSADIKYYPYIREKIYRELIDAWLTQQTKRIFSSPIKKENILCQAKVNDINLGTKSITEGEVELENSFKKCLYTYTENLAKLAWNKGKGQLDIQLTEEETLDTNLLSVEQHEKPFFQHTDSVEMRYFLEIMRSATLLKEKDGLYQFKNKSILELLAEPNLFTGPQVAVDYYLQKYHTGKIPHDFSCSNPKVLKDTQTLDYLAELVRTNADFKSLLYRIIEVSKLEPNAGAAAANAITILKLSGESFSHQNWRGIHIPGADLSDAICEGTDFSYANLTGVNLENTWLRGANLKGAILKNILFYEVPEIKNTANITAMAMDPNRKWLLTGDENGYLTKWDIQTGKALNKWRETAGNAKLLDLYEKNNDLINLAIEATHYSHPSIENAVLLFLMQIVKDHPAVKNIKLSADGRYAIVNDNKNKLWDLEVGKTIKDKNKIAQLNNQICSNKWLGKVDKMNDIDTNVIVLYDAETQQPIKRYLCERPDQHYQHVIVSDDKELFLTVDHGTIEIRDVASGNIKAYFKYDHHNASVPPVFIPGTSTFFYTIDKQIFRWSPEMLRSPVSKKDTISDFTKLPTNSFIPTSFDEATSLYTGSPELSIQLISPAPKQFISDMKAKKGDEWQVVLKQPNGTASNLGIFQPTNGKQFYRAVSPNQQFIVVGATFENQHVYYQKHQTKFSFIDLKNERVFEFKNRHCVRQLQFSQDSQWLLIITDKKVHIFDINQSKFIDVYELGSKHDKIVEIAVSQDKNLLANINEKGILSIWDTENHACIYQDHLNNNLNIQTKSIFTKLDFIYKDNQTYLKVADKQSQYLLFKIRNDSTKAFVVLENRAGFSNLNCASTNLQNSIGLKNSNTEYLKQHGAMGQPLSLDDAKIQALELNNQDNTTHVKQFTYSQFNPKLLLNYSNWTVSLLRDPNSNHPEHAFIVIEGMNAWGKLAFCRFDLVTKDAIEEITPGYAKVVSDITTPVSIKQHRETLDQLLAGVQDDNKRRDVENVYGHTWSLSREKALELIENMNQDKGNLIRFNLAGKDSIASNGKHNCYTWAREKLLGLNIENINKTLKKMPWDMFITNPQWHLTVKPDANQNYYSNHQSSSF